MMPRPRTARCGTDAGYYHHRRTLREDACPACLRAHAAAGARQAAGIRVPVRYCTACGGQTRTKHDKCYVCRKIDASFIGPEPVWVLRGGVWRDRNQVPA